MSFDDIHNKMQVYCYSQHYSTHSNLRQYCQSASTCTVLATFAHLIRATVTMTGRSTVHPVANTHVSRARITHPVANTTCHVSSYYTTHAMWLDGASNQEFFSSWKASGQRFAGRGPISLSRELLPLLMPPLAEHSLSWNVKAFW